MRARLMRRIRRWRELLADRRGSGAVEFAMIAPFLLALYVGASELTLGITADRKTTNAGATISDLVAQESQVTRSQLNAIISLSDTLILPFDADRLRVTVTSVRIDAERRATVDWSTDPARFVKGRPFPALPAGIANQADRFIIVTETVYRYEPVVSAGTLGAFSMRRTAYNQPRVSASVACVDCS
jgi:Flp pilus assembly protein TadG